MSWSSPSRCGGRTVMRCLCEACLHHCLCICRYGLERHAQPRQLLISVPSPKYPIRTASPFTYVIEARWKSLVSLESRPGCSLQKKVNRSRSAATADLLLVNFQGITVVHSKLTRRLSMFSLASIGMTHRVWCIFVTNS
jgi:hypothetical protein